MRNSETITIAPSALGVSLSGLESTAFRAGGAVVKLVAGQWLAARKQRDRQGLELADLISLRFAGLRGRQRNDLRRRLEEIGETAGERLYELAEREFGDLADNERIAALDAVIDTLDGADLSDATLLRTDLDPESLAQDVREQVPSTARRAHLSQAGRALFDLALDQACRQLVHLVRELPEFDTRLAEESLRRATGELARLNQVLERLPVTSLDAPAGTDHDEQFRHRYLALVAQHYDDLELIGVSVRNFRPRTTLSVAYLSLTVHQDYSAHEASGVRHSDAEPDPLRSESPQRAMRVEPALSHVKRTLIRGEAGSGKSSLLRWLAVTAARSHLTGQLATWNGYVPFFVSLRGFAGSPLPRPQDFLSQPDSPMTGPIPDGWIHRQLSSGRALLLVDGVDELTEDERPKVREWLNSLLRTYPNTVLMVTSRPLAAAPDWLSTEGFTALSLQHMSHQDIERFTRHWYRALLDATPDPAVLPYGRADIERWGHELRSHLKTHTHLRNLASNPLMCALLCALHLDRGGLLPQDRTSLYESALEMLLHRRDTERAVPAARSTSLRYSDKVVLLQSIAWWLMLEERSELDYETALALVERSVARIPNNGITSHDAVEHLLTRSGVVRSPAEGKIDFVHRTFQEFLAAREAAESGHVNLLIEHSSSDQWRETIIMASTLLNRSLRERLVDALLERGETHSTSRQLSLLAAACKDSSSDLPAKTLHRVDQAVRSLTPPRNSEHAAKLAELGEQVIEHLPRSVENLTTEQAYPCITTAAMVGGDRALALLANYARAPRPDIHKILFDHWSSFDAEQYSEEILRHFSMPGATITATEPGQLEHLAQRTDIASLVIDLTGHEISDLTLLNSVSGVCQIRVRLSGSADLDPLRAHHDLLRLTITNADQLENVDALEELTSLYQLSIHNETSLNDISFVEQLPGLEGLSLGKLTHVEDYSPLRRLENLRWLTLHDCPGVGDARDIAHLEKLTKLELTECEHREITTAVANHFPRLRRLVLDGAGEVDLEPLTSLPLEELSLKGSSVRDLSALQDMPKLATVMLSDCSHVDDIAPLTRLPELQFTDISRIAPETDLVPLTHMRGGVLAMAPGQDRRNDGRRIQRGPGVRIVYT